MVIKYYHINKNNNNNNKHTTKFDAEKADN